MPTNPTDADLADFLDECGWAATTLVRARSVLCRWERWLAARTPPVAPLTATHRDLKAYLAERVQSGIGPATVHKDWQVITAVYAWAARPYNGVVVMSGRYRGKRLPGSGQLAANPMLRVPEPWVPTTPTLRIADEAGVMVLIDHFGDLARRVRTRRDGEYERALRNAAMVSLMFRSGLRVGELPWIDLDHLVHDEAGNIIAVHVGGDDGRHAKSRKRRLAPVLDETPRLLERYLRRRGQQPGPLFLGRGNHTAALDRRLTAAAIREVVERAAKRSGIAISSHDMRRGFAVEQTRRGADRNAIKTAAGWASDASLNRYLGPEGQVLAVEALHAAAQATPRRLRMVR